MQSQNIFQTLTFPTVPPASEYSEWPQQEPDLRQFYDFKAPNKKPDWLNQGLPEGSLQGYKGQVFENKRHG